MPAEPDRLTTGSSTARGPIAPPRNGHGDSRKDPNSTWRVFRQSVWGKGLVQKHPPRLLNQKNPMHPLRPQTTLPSPAATPRNGPRDRPALYPPAAPVLRRCCAFPSRQVL